MPNMITLGEGGSINPERVILVASMASAPVKRFVKHTDPANLVNLTYGYPRRSVVVFDTGVVAITSYEPERLALAVRYGKEIDPDEKIPF